MLTIEVRFRDELTSRQVRSAVARIKENVKAEYSQIKRIYFAAESVSQNEHEAQQLSGYKPE